MSQHIYIPVLVAVMVVIPALFGVSEKTCAQQAECGCESAEPSNCTVKPTPKPSASATPKKPPLPPVKRRQIANVYPPSKRLVGDRDLPGLDFGSGTALDVGDNFDLGRRYENESAYTGVGHYPERRLFIHRTLEFGRLKAAAGEIPQSNLTSLTRILKEKLERINEQERSEFQDELKAEGQKQLEDLETNVDKQNADRAADIEKRIEKMDLDDYPNLEDMINQVVAENLGQAREQQLLGSNSQNAQARAFSILDKLYARFAKDCEKKKLPISTILSLERSQQITGGRSDLLDKCMSVTAVARVSLPGFEFEAKTCFKPGVTGRARFEGDWRINVVGPLPFKGVAKIRESGGTWNGKASIGEGGGRVDFDANGDADVISEGGQCLLWLKPGESTGDGQTDQFRMVMKFAQPFTGKFPIKVVNEVCNPAPPSQ